MKIDILSGLAFYPSIITIAKRNYVLRGSFLVSGSLAYLTMTTL